MMSKEENTNKQVSKILQALKEEINSFNPPSAYRLYIFFILESNEPLFNDRLIGKSAFDFMLEQGIIKRSGTTKHQGEVCIKYRFSNVKYPKKILYDHKTVKI